MKNTYKKLMLLAASALALTVHGTAMASNFPVELKKDAAPEHMSPSKGEVGKGDSPTTYPLVCRGGNMLYSAAPLNLFSVGFTRGTAPASLDMAPGSCAWLDRGVADSEPATTCQTGTDLWISINWEAQSQLVQSISHSPSLPYIDVLGNPGEYFTFNVYNNGAGCMVVTSFGQ